MKMKLKDVRKNLIALNGLGKLTLPSKLSFAVAKNLELLQAEDERTEKERRKICEAYAEKDENGRPVKYDSIVNGKKTQEYKIPDKDRAALDAEYEELMDIEVDINIRMVKRSEIERCEEIERYSIPNVAQIYAMGFMTE